ncbi:MAG: hypothetical protein V3S83_12590 [Gemmatimonadota bacterium]
MGTTITPGFDFAVNAVPDGASLRLQAKSLKLTGASTENLAVGLVGMKYGDVSNATSALQVGDAAGSIWVDPQGAVWVKEQSGDVKLHRAMEGGWETRRYYVIPSTAFPNALHPGQSAAMGTVNGPDEDHARAEADPTVKAGASPNLQIHNNGSYDDSSGSRQQWVVQDTGASSYLRVAGRGGSCLHAAQTGQSGTFNTMNDLRTHYRLGRPDLGVNPQYEYMTTFGAALTAHRWSCLATAVHSESSVVSNANPNLNSVREVIYGHYFGPAQYTNRHND